MTNEELQKIAEAVQALDEFAATAPLRRGWHGTWQQVYSQTMQQIAALVDEPVDKTANKKPGRTPAKS